MMEFLTEYNLTGLVIGVATFLIIGLFHPFVIKGRTGRRNNPAVAPACRRAGPERQSARRGGSPAGRESPSGAEWSGLRPRFSAV